jgi:hypothetical protein
MSPAYQFHPEFGYFCPTPGFRRKLRVGLTCIILGVLAGSAGTLVLKAAHDSKSGGSAMTFVQVDDPASDGHATAALAAEQPAPAATDEKPRAAEVGKPACGGDGSVDQTWAYLDGKCAPGRTRKTRVTRTPPQQGASIAAIPLGRTAPPSAGKADPAAAAASSPDRRQPSPVPVAQPAPVSVAEAPVANPPTVKPAEPAAAAPKKAQKTARRANSDRTRAASQAAPRDPRLHPGQPNGRVYAMPDARAQQRGPFDGGGLFGGGPFGLFR